MKWISAVALSPMTYVVGFATSGAAGIVAGVGLLAGAGWALITAGVLALAASAYISRGLNLDA